MNIDLNKDIIGCIETLFKKLEKSLEQEIASYRKQAKTVYEISVISEEIIIKNTPFKIRVFFTEKDITTFKIINLVDYHKQVDKELTKVDNKYDR
jgi:hypothetical protein